MVDDAAVPWVMTEEWLIAGTSYSFQISSVYCVKAHAGRWMSCVRSPRASQRSFWATNEVTFLSRVSIDVPQRVSRGLVNKICMKRGLCQHVRFDTEWEGTKGFKDFKQAVAVCAKVCSDGDTQGTQEYLQNDVRSCWDAKAVHAEYKTTGVSLHPPSRL